MKRNHRRPVSCAVRFALMMALAIQAIFVISANADNTAASYNENWENVSETFTKQIGANDIDPAYLRRCNGLIITPNGDIVIQTSNKGICVSKDQGATWSVVADNKIKGRCENGFCVSLAYPYDGRMAFFCYDGTGGMSGGMSLDGAKTWCPFSQVQRGVTHADVDWNADDPQIIFGLTHEPFFTLLSDDGGETWRRLDNAETGSGPEVNFCVGVINEKTLIRSNPAKQGGIIELSNDAGQTWTQVANYQVQGREPVHYGRNVYWTTTKGVITSTNGKDWTLTGAGAEGALYGPYFGSSEQEFVVVTDSYFLKTEDGGKTWKSIAKLYKAPDIFRDLAGYYYYGWDSRHNILYTSGIGASVYRLKLNAPAGAQPASADTSAIENIVVKTRAGQPITTTLHAIDNKQPNGTYSYHITQQPRHGTATVSGDTLTYTAQGGFLGADDFTCQANDGKSDSNQAVITVKVMAPITGPTIGVALDAASPQAKFLAELTPTVMCPDVLPALSDGHYPLVVAAATPTTLKTLASHPEVIQAFTAKGGWLMLWGLTPDGLADFNRLVGVEHLLRPFTVEAVGLPANVDPLLNGLNPSSLNMLSGEGLQGIRLRAADVWSYVLDGEDIAPFAKIPSSDYWRPGEVTGPGSDGYPPNLVNGMDDSWQLGFTIPITKPEYLKWNFDFPRPETVTQFSLTPDTTYNKIQRIRLTFPGSATPPLEFAVQPSMTRQDFPVPNIQSTGVTLELITETQGKVAVTGIRNVWIKVQRSDDFKQKVQPLLSIGVLNKYPMGKGGILINEMQPKEDDLFIYHQQKRILGVLMHNLLDKPQ